MILAILQDEVHHMCWQLPFQPCTVTELPGIVLAPLGLAHQQTINELGEIIPKEQLTHNQSFNVVPGTKRSINDGLHLDTLTPCHLGHAVEAQHKKTDEEMRTRERMRQEPCYITTGRFLRAVAKLDVLT
jgi:hypothetical protein